MSFDFAQDLFKKPDKRKKFLLLLGALLFFNLFVFGAFYYSIKNNKNLSKIAFMTNKASGILATPTPFPFYELTITYLRQRSYDSRLLEMREVARNSGYASYLASYTSDSLKINGLLTVPTGNKPDEGWPAIIFVHGYITP